MTLLPTRRFVLATAALGLAAGVLAGCADVGGVREAGDELMGKERMAPLRVAPPKDRVTVQFQPFTGLPVNAADSIYRKIRAAAAENGVELVHRLEIGRAHV